MGFIVNILSIFFPLSALRGYWDVRQHPFESCYVYNPNTDLWSEVEFVKTQMSWDNQQRGIWVKHLASEVVERMSFKVWASLRKGNKALT